MRGANNPGVKYLSCGMMILACSTRTRIAAGFTQCNHLFGAAKTRSSQGETTSRHLSIPSDNDSRPITNVAIIGGGIAGLSTAYHLLNHDVARQIKITVYDKANIGEGGASSVAGGLMHPFSPRGKLVHFGLSALEHSNHLIEMATKHPPHQCITRPCLYRVALSSKNVIQLQYTADNYPKLATWKTKEEMLDKFGIDSLGGLELGNGCKVVHVPSYLKGLWEECQIRAKEINGTIKWENTGSPTNKWSDIDLFNQHLAHYDAVILSAGAGILHDNLLSSDAELPVQLVRGQSIEMTLSPEEASDAVTHEAFLCGKYIAPLPTKANDSSQRFVIGATQEFGDDANALSATDVVETMKGRSYSLGRNLWDNGTIDRVTTGVRMQSNRNGLGRMPIIGRNTNISKAGINHANCWIFTGLSSRGMIYHGIFGRWLADAVLQGNEEELRNEFPEFDWWRKKSSRDRT